MIVNVVSQSKNNFKVGTKTLYIIQNNLVALMNLKMIYWETVHIIDDHQLVVPGRHSNADSCSGDPGSILAQLADN